MKQYKVPPDTNRKEKLIGDFTLSQGMYLIVSFITGLILALALFQILKAYGVVIGFSVFFIGVPFAFFQKHGLGPEEIYKRKQIFKKKTKILTNKRKKEGEE